MHIGSGEQKPVVGRYYLPSQESPVTVPRPGPNRRLPIEILRDELIEAASLRLESKAHPVVAILLGSPPSRGGLTEAVERIAVADIEGVSPEHLADIAAQLRGLMSAWSPSAPAGIETT